MLTLAEPRVIINDFELTAGPVSSPGAWTSNDKTPVCRLLGFRACNWNLSSYTTRNYSPTASRPEHFTPVRQHTVGEVIRSTM